MRFGVSGDKGGSFASDGSPDGAPVDVLAAGSDVALHCNGNLAEMQEIAAVAPVLAGRALERFEVALAVARAPRQPFDRVAAETVTERLLAPIA